MELSWEPTLAGLDVATLRAGIARWVLTQADGEAAILWGQSAGIGLFQGEAVQAGGAVPETRRGARLTGAGHDKVRTAA